MNARSDSDKRSTDHAEAPSLGLRVGVWLSALVFVMGAVLLSLELWLARTWAELSPDEIIFHLKASLAGTDTTVIKNYCLRYLPFVLASCAAAYLCQRTARRKGTRVLRTTAIATAVVGCLLAGVALVRFSAMVSLGDFLALGSSGEESGFIEEHYVNPADVEITFPEKKRNLIYIYLESMELTFADANDGNGGAWSENLIPELTEIAHEGESFGTENTLNGGFVLPGTAWTMGAMFGQSSGVPLKLPFYGNYISEQMSDFFPGIVTIGDLLEGQGYRQLLMIGSDAAFGARDMFYREHGNYELYDYPRAIEDGFIPADYLEFWGFEDEKLFQWAKQVLPELAAGDEPFNLTMLTVDTHFEDGYVCRLCTDEHGDNQYANVMSCSSRQVAAFVRWIQQQDFYENTTVIVCGDHTTMDSDFCREVPKDYLRRTYVSILNGAAQREDPTVARDYSTLDLFPTTLAAMGVTIEGDQLGLGVNLYAETPTIVEECGLDTCRTELKKMSLFLDQFSDVSLSDVMIDQVKQECTLSYDDGTLGFGGFLLGDMGLVDPTTIEDAHLVLKDDRTQKTTSYNMVQWSSNEKFAHHASLEMTHYYLGAQMELGEEDLAHLQATAYLTIKGHDEQVFGTWDLETARAAEQAASE